MDREGDTDTVGKVDLLNVDAASGTSITNAQREANSIASFTGKAVNVAKDNKPTWSSDAIGTPNQNTKDRVDSVQAVVEANTSDVADIRTTQGTSDGDTDMGLYTGTVLTDNTTVKANIQEVGTQVDTNVTDIGANASDIADIRSTTGTSDTDTDMGAYTGGVLTDNQTTKQNIQEVADALEPLLTALVIQGNWNATTNSPALVSSVGTPGHFYVVTVAGSTNLDGETDWQVGDWAVFGATTWFKQDNSSIVHTGEVTGATTLTVDPTAITNKTLVTPIAGDFFLYSDTSDGGALKRANFSDLGGGATIELDNLGVTNVNADIIPDGFGNRSLGSVAKPWLRLRTRLVSYFASSGNNTFNVEADVTSPSGVVNCGAATSTFRKPAWFGSVDTNDTVETSGKVLLESGNQTDATGVDSGLINIKSGDSTNANSGIINIEPGAAPGAGTRGTVNLNIASKGTAGHVVKSSGTAGEMVWGPESGGGGGLNYLEGDNTNFEGGIGDWVTYADGGGSPEIPIDGTGGVAGPAFAQTVVAAEILRGTASGELAKTAVNSQGDGVSVNFSIDEIDQGKRIFVKLEGKNSAAYASGDLRGFVYDVTNANLIGALENNDGGDIISNTGEGSGFAGSFAAAIDSQSYRLILHITSTNASAWDFFIDRVEIGPDSLVPGAIITNWVPFTPSFNNLTGMTPSVANSEWRQNGENLEIRGDFTSSGTYSNVSTLSFDIPDTSLNISAGNCIGYYDTFDMDNSGLIETSTMQRVSATTIGFVHDATSAFVHEADLNSSTSMNYRVSAKIDEWTAGAVLSTTDVIFSTVRASAAGDPASATVGNPIIFPTERWDDTGSYDNSTGRFTSPRAGFIRVHGAIESANAGVLVHVYKNAVSEVLAGSTDSNGEGVFSATVEVVKGDIIDLRPNGTLDAISGSVINFEEQPDFNTFSVRGVNEFIDATSSLKTLGTTGDWVAFTGNSIPLTPGIFVLHGTVQYTASGGAADFTRLITMWGSANGADTSSTPAAIDNPAAVTLQAGKDDNADWSGLASIEAAALQAPAIRVIVTDDTTVYLNAFANATAANARLQAHVYAERIA